jgi:hypothetical protein
MLGDLFRFWWALCYWNARKTVFVLRGARGAAPCQNPSDSGRAGETSCEACLQWRNPGRFRAVCPALVASPQGWRCSLDASGVRPFWRRAVVAGAVAGMLLWIVGTLGGWGACRAVGYRELRYADFWSVHFRARFRSAQADYYQRQAAAAFAAGDFSRGLMALFVAYDRNPQNLEAGLLLAQLLQRTRQAERGDRLFQRLLHDFPTRHEEIAAAWADALLAREDYAALVRLAAQETGASGRATAVWARALVYALRQLDAAVFATAATTAESAVPERWREIVTIERRLRAGDTTGAKALLTAPALVADPFAIYYRVETLLQLGALDEAATILRQGAGLLGQFHHHLLGYRIAVARGPGPAADLLFESLLQSPLIPEKIELLSAELLRRPVATRVAELFAAVERNGGIPARNDVQIALLIAAAASDDSARVAQVIARSREVSPGAEAGLKRLAVYLRGGAEAEPLHGLLDTLPVPRELVYALLEMRRAQ